MCFSIQAQTNLKELSQKLNTPLNTKAYESFRMLQEFEASIDPLELKKILGLKRKPSSDVFKTADSEGRIFPNYFTNIITQEGKERTISPMRYRIRPRGSQEEIPTKFNVFNARLDSLEKRQTWAPLFMKNHGVVAFDAFYEWVEKDGKKTLIKFHPEDGKLILAPCLWDEWTSNDKQISFKSFAIITTDPPKEIEVMGHDRCPIFLKEENLSDWLNPKTLRPQDAYEILTHPYQERYDYEWA
ncbi:SOS response-associated peptidase family protein [Halobacteriovorax sp. GFR7]|uniref:SOS response-associated peptidase family protein n=1 Tax=unclassified Halobacteriovorax TaxID=2639665 RepID=UPI00371FF561